MPRFDERIVKSLDDEKKLLVDYAACSLHRKAFRHTSFLLWRILEIPIDNGVSINVPEARPRPNCVCCRRKPDNCECHFISKMPHERFLLIIDGFEILDDLATARVS
jgi:hypothetical protein